MKITAVGAGSRGDVEPLVHLGKEMKRRGHASELHKKSRFLTEYKKSPKRESEITKN